MGQPKEMQRLCTPDRKVYKIEHEDEAQLRSIKQRYNLTANVVHNLRQLLGWRAVGTPKGGANDRVKRLERGGGQLPDPLQCRQTRLGCYRPVAQARRRYSRQAARRWTAGPTPAQRMSFCVCVCACRWCKHVKTLSTRSTHSDKGTSDSSPCTAKHERGGAESFTARRRRHARWHLRAQPQQGTASSSSSSLLHTILVSECA